MAFGGGRYRCPGRYFAEMEVALFVAIALSKYDFAHVHEDDGIDYETKTGRNEENMYAGHEQEDHDGHEAPCGGNGKGESHDSNGNGTRQNEREDDDGMGGVYEPRNSNGGQGNWPNSFLAEMPEDFGGKDSREVARLEQVNIHK